MKRKYKLSFVQRVRTSVRKACTGFPKRSLSTNAALALFQKREDGSTVRRTSSLARVLSIVGVSAATAGITLRSTTHSVLAKPIIQMLLYERIVLKMRICLADAVDFFHLPGRKFFLWIETPAPLEQSLPPEDFVNAGNAPVKVVRGIEDGRVGVGDLRR